MSRNDPRFDDLLAQAFASPNAAESDSPDLAQLKRMARAMAVPSFEAPTKLSDAARAIFPRRQPIRARILGGTLWGAGARRAGTPDSFQIAYGSEETHVRVQYGKVESGWEVLGRAPAGAEAWMEGKAVPTDADGSFRAVARRLEATSLLIRTDAGDIAIPSAAEALEHGPDRDD